MAFDEGVAQRVREALDCERDVVEKKMFGGLAFMLYGHMCVGVVGDEMMVRVGPEGYEAALALPSARKMDFTGKPLKGFVYVGVDGFDEDENLQEWVDLGRRFVSTLPSR